MFSKKTKEKSNTILPCIAAYFMAIIGLISIIVKMVLGQIDGNYVSYFFNRIISIISASNTSIVSTLFILSNKNINNTIIKRYICIITSIFIYVLMDFVLDSYISSCGSTFLFIFFFIVTSVVTICIVLDFKETNKTVQEIFEKGMIDKLNKAKTIDNSKFDGSDINVEGDKNE